METDNLTEQEIKDLIIKFNLDESIKDLKNTMPRLQRGTSSTSQERRQPTPNSWLGSSATRILMPTPMPDLSRN